MEIILATRNPSKALQIKELFDGSSIRVLTLDDVGVKGEAVEDGTTLKENARKKVMFVRERYVGNTWIMADDTGLFVHALNGEPGVQAAYWAGQDASTNEITAHALKEMKGLTDRSATFETIVAVLSPAGKEYFFSGEVKGTMQEVSRCEAQPKMPYSPLFQPHDSNKVWAEMTTEEENAISHRGIAFRKVREFLEQFV